MIKIKKIMVSQLKKVTIVVVGVIVLLFVIIQLASDKKMVRNQAKSLFDIIEQITIENEYEMRAMEEDLRNSQISAVEIVSYMLEMNPEKRNDPLWLKDLAFLVDVDEILFYDETGCLVGGTDHTYLGYSFEDGEQLSYFKPLLKNKFLKLSQEQIPRSFDGKEYRYAACWSNDDTYIIQVGTGADKYQEITERFDLSYVLKLLKANTEAIFHIIDARSNVVVASTNTEDINKTIEEIGYKKNKLENSIPCNLLLDGKKYYSISSVCNNRYLLYSTPLNELYKDIIPQAIEISILLYCIAYIIILAVTKYVDSLVIKNIETVNENLSKISEGNLETKIEINNSFEFNELSNFINTMVQKLKVKAEERDHIFSIVAQHSNKILYRYVLSEAKTYPWDAENAKKDVLAHLYKNAYFWFYFKNI